MVERKGAREHCTENLWQRRSRPTTWRITAAWESCLSYPSTFALPTRPRTISSPSHSPLSPSSPYQPHIPRLLVCPPALLFYPAVILVVSVPIHSLRAVSPDRHAVRFDNCHNTSGESQYPSRPSLLPASSLAPAELVKLCQKNQDSP